MKEVQVGPSIRRVVEPAREAALQAERANKGHDGIFCGAAAELRDGTIVTGKNSPLMHATSALVMNAAKTLAEIPDRIPLLPPSIIESVARLKQNVLGSKRVSLDLDEALIALSICAAGNPTAQLAMERLGELSGCEVHLTHIPDADMPHYAAAKAAILNLTKSLSKACARDGILVNAISPGVIATPAVEEMAADTAKRLGTSVAEVLGRFLAKRRPHLELQRPGTAEEVAAVVLFLASEAASFMTGANVRIDGGAVASL